MHKPIYEGLTGRRIVQIEAMQRHAREAERVAQCRDGSRHAALTPYSN